MSDQAVNFLRTLANLTYGISLTEALTILDAALDINPVVFDWNSATLEQKVERTRTLPAVMAHIGQNYETTKKIQAIKELRSESKMGLKESKDVIDALTPKRELTARYCCYTYDGDLHSSSCYTQDSEPPF